MPTGQTYDKTFKQEAVRVVKTSGKSQRQVANDLGVGMSTLLRWWSEMEEQGEYAFVGSGNLQPELAYFIIPIEAASIPARYIRPTSRSWISVSA